MSVEKPKLPMSRGGGRVLSTDLSDYCPGDDNEPTTTDLEVLRRKIAAVTKAWDELVADYRYPGADPEPSTVDHAAVTYFGAVSALNEFDGHYRDAKAAINQNFELARRFSGRTLQELSEMLEKSE